MALTITSISPAVIAPDGGYKLTLTGQFPLNTALNVYLGATGTIADAACYSGVRGQGATCYALNATTLVCFTPAVSDDLGDYILLVVAPSLSQQVTRDQAVLVRPPFFYSQVFALRSVLPINYATGPRNLDAAPQS